MPLRFTCPHCGSVTLVDDQYSGHSGPCVACEKPIQLPNFATGQAAPSTGLRYGRALVILAISVLLGGGIIFLVRAGANAASNAQQSLSKSRCQSKLQKIAAALNAYADDYQGRYPPPVVTDANGKPLFSWRVLILPYLGEQDLYTQFDRSQAWDSPENMSVLFAAPRLYMSPGASLIDGDTSYYLITGNGTLFPAGGAMGPDQILDGPEKTLLVVEAARAPSTQAPWTQPGDLDVANMRPQIGGIPGIEIGGTFPAGANVVTADGVAHFLRDSLSPPLLRSLMTPAGGEAIPDDALD